MPNDNIKTVAGSEPDENGDVALSADNIQGAVTQIVDQYGNAQPKLDDGHTVQVTLGGGDAQIGALTVTLQVVPGTATYNVNGVTSSMVVAESHIDDGVQGSEWTIVTGEESIRIDGTISKSGSVRLVLVQNGADFLQEQDARFTALEGFAAVKIGSYNGVSTIKSGKTVMLVFNDLSLTNDLSIGIPEDMYPPYVIRYPAVTSTGELIRLLISTNGRVLLRTSTGATLSSAVVTCTATYVVR